MKINKHLIAGIIISASLVSGMQANALSPEASVLYQEACSAEHQQDIKTAIAKLEQAIQISGADAMLYTKLAGLYSETDATDKALETSRIYQKTCKKLFEKNKKSY